MEKIQIIKMRHDGRGFIIDLKDIKNNRGVYKQLILPKF